MYILKITLFHLTYSDMTSEYAEASFSTDAYTWLQFFGMSNHRFLAMYSAIFKTYYTPIRPLTRALKVTVANEKCGVNCVNMSMYISK